jgi:hypothetical protein
MCKDEDSKLKDAVQTHCGWGPVTTLVPSQTRNQCYRRWNDALDPIIGRANGRTGKWMAAEGSKLKLKDVVQMRSGKDLRLTCLVGCASRSRSASTLGKQILDRAAAAMDCASFLTSRLHFVC